MVIGDVLETPNNTLGLLTMLAVGLRRQLATWLPLVASKTSDQENPLYGDGTVPLKKNIMLFMSGVGRSSKFMVNFVGNSEAQQTATASLFPLSELHAQPLGIGPRPSQSTYFPSLDLQIGALVLPTPATALQLPVTKTSPGQAHCRRVRQRRDADSGWNVVPENSVI